MADYYGSQPKKLLGEHDGSLPAARVIR